MHMAPAGFAIFDTAPHYGLGLSEMRLGKALQMHAKGKDVRIWTKTGRRMIPRVEIVEGVHKVEASNLPENGSIFPDSPRDVAPVLDYTAEGSKASYKDSMRRILGMSASVDVFCTSCSSKSIII